MNESIQQTDSLRRLYSNRKPLTEHAANLAVSMKAKLPDEPLTEGRLYQLAGKSLGGVDAIALIVIPNAKAICIDLSTGVIGTVDKHGVRKTTLIGGRQ